MSASDRAVAWARELRHIPSLGIGLVYSAVGFAFLGDRSRTEERVTELLALAKQYGLPAMHAYAYLLYGWATGDASQSPFILMQLRSMGCRLGLPFYTSLLADGHARQGRLDLAIDCIDQCLQLGEETGERCYEAELHRRRAGYELQLGEEGAYRAPQSLWLAISRAQRFGMPVVELKALDALARLGQDVPLHRVLELRQALPQLTAALMGAEPHGAHT